MAAALALWLVWPLADAQQGLWRTLTMWTVGGVAGAAAVEVHALISPRPPTEPLPRTERVELRDVIVFQTLVITGAAAFAFSSAPELGAAMWLYGAGCLALAAWRLRRGWAATRKQRTSQPR